MIALWRHCLSFMYSHLQSSSMHHYSWARQSYLYRASALRIYFQLIKEQQASVFAGVPTMYNFLYQFPEGKAEDFQSIRTAISGGTSLPVALLHNFEDKFKVRVSEGYGLSEASPVTCFNPLDRERMPGSIGTNIVNVENKIVDELGNEIPDGEVGELDRTRTERHERVL